MPFLRRIDQEKAKMQKKKIIADYILFIRIQIQTHLLGASTLMPIENIPRKISPKPIPEWIQWDDVSYKYRHCSTSR